MVLTTLSLSNFRSYNERTFILSPEVTLITGKNGAGKTNILEAIHVVLHGKSFRDSDEQLLNYTAEWWKIKAKIDSVEREVRYQPAQGSAKQLFIDGTRKGRFTYRHQLPVVLFEPDNLLLLHGSPARRRAYVDGLISSLLPAYRSALNKYERALLQRNNVLKQGGPLSVLKDMVFVWDIALSEHGATIQTAREQLVTTLNEQLSNHYSSLAMTAQTLLLDYGAGGQHDSRALMRELAHSFEKDVRRGFTSVGPHRDDLNFILNGKDAQTTASRGEVRTIVLALKYAELQLLSGPTAHSSPIFLLDDVFSELDTTRQAALLAHTEGVQKIITTTQYGGKNREVVISL